MGPEGPMGPVGPKGDKGDAAWFTNYESPNNYIATNFCQVGATRKDGLDEPFVVRGHGFAANKQKSLAVCMKLCDDAPDCKSFMYRREYEGENAHICNHYVNMDLELLNNGQGWNDKKQPGGEYNAIDCHDFFQFVKTPKN